MKKYWLLPAGMALFLFACTKDNQTRVQLYPDGPKAEIRFLDGLPSPSQGRAGAPVTFKVLGLKGKENNFKFLMGQLETEVITVGDSTVTVRVPEDAITGGAAVVYNNQYYFGPEFRVRGNISIDPAFTAFNGAEGTIFDVVPATGLANNYIVAGSFTNYQNQGSPAAPIINLARISGTGAPMTGSADRLLTRTGAEGGAVYAIAPMSTSQYLISGFFSRYNERDGISSITRVYQRAQLDTSVVTLVNTDPINNPNDDRDTVATFNGGVNGVIRRAFETTSGQIIAVGAFTEYRSYFYERSTKSAKVTDRVLMNTVLRMNSNGTLDSTFNYDLALHRGKPGVNGAVSEALRISGNRIVIVGNFTNYNGSAAGRIVAVNESDGSVATNFNTGTGADGVITAATYNATTGRILLTGEFRNFNGTPVNGVVMLKTDGSIDTGFTLSPVEGGMVTFATQLNSGRILIAGNFQKYNGKIRPGFGVLDASGNAIQGYNNLGAFSGTVYKALERTTEQGYPGVILVGNFSRFDNTEVRNIVFLEIRN